MTEANEIQEPKSANEKFLFEINEIYVKKIPWIVLNIGICTLTGAILSIANLFLIASGLGITDVFVFVFSTPVIILFSILIGILMNANERKLGLCIIYAVGIMIALQIIMLFFMPLYAGILTIILSIVFPSAICILILAPTIQPRARKEEFPNKGLSKPTIIFLFLTFSLIHCIGAFPISKLYNYRQIETAKMLVEKFEITQKENHIEILLPSEYAKHNNYLKSTFSSGWFIDSMSGEPLKYLWQEEHISCSEGKKKWYIARIPFPERIEDILLLHFKHPYEDYEVETKRFSFLNP